MGSERQTEPVQAAHFRSTCSSGIRIIAARSGSLKEAGKAVCIANAVVINLQEFAKTQRWKCRSDGKGGRQDREAILSTLFPHTLETAKSAIPHYYCATTTTLY